MYNWAKKALPRNFFLLLSYNVFCIPSIVLGPFSIIILKLLAYSEVHQLFFYYYYYLFLKAHGLYYRLGFRRNKLYCLVTNLTHSSCLLLLSGMRVDVLYSHLFSSVMISYLWSHVYCLILFMSLNLQYYLARYFQWLYFSCHLTILR